MYTVLVCMYIVLVCMYTVLVCMYTVLVCMYTVLVCMYTVFVCMYTVFVNTFHLWQQAKVLSFLTNIRFNNIHVNGSDYHEICLLITNTTYFHKPSCTVLSYAAWAVKSIWKETVAKMCTFIMTSFYHEKPVQYSQYITFWQVLSSIAIGLFVSDPLWGVGWTSRLAVIFGTLVGFIMICIIIIITTLLNSPMHRYVVCNKFVFWHSFASQRIVLTQLSLATEHISDTIVTYLIVFNDNYR